MGRDERIQKILESWRGPQRLKEDTWSNVQLVLAYYAFTFERKYEWVCTHNEFMELARNPRAKALLRNYKLGVRGDFSISVTHSSNTKAGMVKRCYLNDILKYIELLEIHMEKKRTVMKDLDYYMSLPYEIKVQEFSEDDGGGIMLSIPLLGEAAVRGYGNTYSEARAKLEAVKKDFLEIWLKDGWEIPEPQLESWTDIFASVRNLD